MSLHSDNQTLADINVTDSLYGEKTLLSLFKSTRSDGGKRLLEEWICEPLNDLKSIQKRLEASCLDIPPLHIDREELDFIEFYLSQEDKPTRFSPFESFFMMLLRLIRKEDSQRYIIARGCRLMIELMHKLVVFAESVTEESPLMIQSFARTLQDIFSSPELKELLSTRARKRNVVDFADYLFRYRMCNLVGELMEIVYQLDVFQTVHRVAKERNLCYPEMIEKGELSLSGFYHPHLEAPVANDWRMGKENICLFTGSNMAGKSTTLRGIASAVWLAHVGLPVPATSMTCPVFDGVFTSINLPDSMKDGRSHFYAEVLRIREVLEKIKQGKNCFVLFDELFRGTNARDAFEASVAVVDLLEQRRGSVFLISTHIIELAHHFTEAPFCCFYYMESSIENDSLVCGYKLREGISESRVGYWMVKKELTGI